MKEHFADVITFNRLPPAGWWGSRHRKVYASDIKHGCILEMAVRS